MNSVEYVRKICKERRISIAMLERDCGFSNGYIAGLRRGIFPSDRLAIISEYLDIPMEQILMPPDETTGKIIGQSEWYNDPEAVELAQAMFDDPDLHALMDAARDCRPEYIKSAVQLLKTLKETNIDG